jgi:hypothetical protein
VQSTEISLFSRTNIDVESTFAIPHRLEAYATLLTSVWSDVSKLPVEKVREPTQPRDRLVYMGFQAVSELSTL